MKTLFSSFYQPKTAEPIALVRRCWSSILAIASIWNMVGILIMSFARGVPGNSPMHPKLQILSIGSIFVAGGLYSVLIPIYFILRGIEAK